MPRTDATIDTDDLPAEPALESHAGFGPLPYGGTIVAGPGDDSMEMARLEILAALGGGPPPGTRF